MQPDYPGVERKRSKDEIVRSILAVVAEGFDTKIKVMHASFLTLHLATKYLDELGSQGLLLFEPESRKYVVSEAGKIRFSAHP